MMAEERDVYGTIRPESLPYPDVVDIRARRRAMTADWSLSPWVEERRERMSFGLQIFPIDTKINPARHLLAAGQLAEELGFDALFLGDHPAWALECWIHLAALAVTTNRIRLGI